MTLHTCDIWAHTLTRRGLIWQWKEGKGGRGRVDQTPCYPRYHQHGLIPVLQIVDFPVDHPSCSKQHAVLQYRLVDYVKNDGSKGRRVRLEVMLLLPHVLVLYCTMQVGNALFHFYMYICACLHIVGVSSCTHSPGCM